MDVGQVTFFFCSDNYAESLGKLFFVEHTDTIQILYLYKAAHFIICLQYLNKIKKYNFKIKKQ